MLEPPFRIGALHLKALGGVGVGGPSRFFPAIGDDNLAIWSSQTYYARPK
jgi:hypothetical protein